MKSLLSKISHSLFHHLTWKGYWEPLVQRFKPAWRDGLFRAQITSATYLNPNTLQILLSPEKKWPVHLAGQHVSLTLEINGRLTTRVFTIASGASTHALENKLRLIIRIKEQGALTPHLPTLSPGQWVNISPPMGRFALREDKDILMIAGGSGITPFIAMLEDYTSKHAAKHSSNDCNEHHSSQASMKPNIHLLYYAKQGEHLLIDELSNISSKLPNFAFRLLTKANDGDVERYLPEFNSYEWMVCGPLSLYGPVSKNALANNISLESEHFTALLPTVFDSSEEEQTFLIQHDNKALHVNNQQSLLTQLQQASVPVNYGCGMGICHQCQCVKKQGIVRDMRTGELSDNAEELIQLCVSQAVTNLELQS